MVRKLKGATLFELLIIVLLISIVMLIVFGTNFYSQIMKARDAKRKENLVRIQKVIEDFHIDHNRYPSIEEMAYEIVSDSPQTWETALAGKVCGKTKTSAIIQNYVGELPCDERSPDDDYIYFLFDNKQKYALFTDLDVASDPDIENIGCKYGCSYYLDLNDPVGSVSNNYYNYYVSSTNFAVSDCYGRTTYTACYSGRSNPSSRCTVCPDGSCEPGYVTLYCNVNWCLQDCGF